MKYEQYCHSVYVLLWHTWELVLRGQAKNQDLAFPVSPSDELNDKTHSGPHSSPATHAVFAGMDDTHRVRWLSQGGGEVL